MPPTTTAVADWTGYVQPSIKIDKVIGCRQGKDGPNVVLRMKVYGGNAVISHTPIVNLDEALKGGWLSGDEKGYGNPTYSKVDDAHSVYIYRRVTGTRFVSYSLFQADMLSVPFNYKQVPHFLGKQWYWDPYYQILDGIPGQPLTCPFMDESPATGDVPPPPTAPIPPLGQWAGYQQPKVEFDGVVACKKPTSGIWLGQTVYAVRFKLSGGNSYETIQEIADLEKFLTGQWGGARGAPPARLDGTSTAFSYGVALTPDGALRYRDIIYYGFSLPFDWNREGSTPIEALRRWPTRPFGGDRTVVETPACT